MKVVGGNTSTGPAPPTDITAKGRPLTSSPTREQVAAVFDSILPHAQSAIQAARWTADGFHDHALSNGSTTAEADTITDHVLDTVAAHLTAILTTPAPA